MPLWLSILLAGLPGAFGLVGAFIYLGGMRRDVHDLTKRSEGWDQLKTDVSYIRGVLDGKREAIVETLADHLQEPRPHANVSRPRSRASKAA